MKNNRTLFIVFVVLLALFLASRFFDRPEMRSFEKVLVAVDTATVEEIRIHPKDGGELIQLERTGGTWTASSSGLKSRASRSVIQSILNQLVSIEAKRIVARTEDKWGDYGVDPSNSSRIEVMDNRKVLADFVIGRFNFNQQTRQPLTYIRKTSSNDTYVVEGFLGMSFDQSFDSFRDKTIVRAQKEAISGLIYRSGDLEIEINGNNGDWMANGTPLDSLSLGTYLNGLSSVTATSFYTEDNIQNGGPIESIEIILNSEERIRVDAYSVLDSDAQIALRSSINEDSFFGSDTSGIYKTLFTDLKVLF